VEWGATVGQAISKFGVQLVDGSRHQGTGALPAAVANQFSRSYLWRTYGFFRSLEGWSGSPLVVHDDEDFPRSVIGFQNFQWVVDPEETWGWSEEELEQQVKEDIEKRIITRKFPFYGAYFLPNAVKGSTILATFEDDDAGKGTEAGEI
jgi:hypothetical protein